ncbi:uncharacterized protein PAE49_003820 [Odontesthes bonariensis]|uniref:uncharacterized protein LOC142379066 n=1 Tax=Odontesthes bonariensis TaxID=219752 RepID=UPI003F58DB29
MPTHRRGRSLSEALTLEQSEEGGLVISSLSSASHNQGLKEGDEILGATIHFDQLSKEEVLKVLKLMEPFDDKIHVLTRNSLSKSLGDLDQCARSPETMLKDSYSKLYNGKIKKFMRDDLSGADEGCVNGEITGKPTVSASSKVNLKQDMGLPRLGVDFGLLKPKTLGTDANADSHSDAEESKDGSNLNFPPLGLGLNGITQSDAQVPRLKLEARDPQLNAPDFHLSDDDPNVNAAVGSHLPNTDSALANLAMTNLERAPQMGLDLKASDVSSPKMEMDLNREIITDPSFNAGVPKLDIEGINPEFKMPKFKLPYLALSGPPISNPECNVKTPEIETTEIPLGKLSLKHSKRPKNPDLNLDDPSSFDGASKFGLSVKLPEKSGFNLSQVGVNGTDIDMPLDTDIKEPLKKPKTDFKSAGLDVDAPSGTVSLPKYGLSGKGKSDVKTPDLSLKTPKSISGISASDMSIPKADQKGMHLAIDTQSVDIKGQSGKYKAPKFTMPKFDLPDIQVSVLDGDLVEGELKTPDFDFSKPKFKGTIGSADLNMPGIGLQKPKQDLSGPDANFDMLSGKFKVPEMKKPNVDLKVPDMHIDESSSKFKMPKFSFSSTLPKEPNLDMNTNINSPHLSLKTSKIKGGIDAPNLDSPNMDFKSPKIDVNTPDVNLDMPSGKLKMPELHAPDWDLNAPSSKLKMPKFSLSGTLPKRPDVDLNADLKSTDFSLKAPKMKGGMNAPDLDFPNMHLKDPKLDVSTPDLNIGSPKTKLKFPKLKMPKFGLPNLKGPEIDANFDGPGINVNAPDVNFKGTKADLDLDISGQSGKFKKPNLNLPDLGLSGPKLHGPNLDLTPPDFDISGSNLSGAINAPDMNMPKVDFKTPKLDLNTPDVNLDMPSGKLKMPELHAPDWDLNAPSSKLKMPKFSLSGMLPKRPDVDLNADLKSTDFSLKAPKMKGGMNAPDLDFPNMHLKDPKLDVSTPDLNIGSPKTKLKFPKLKMPKFGLPNLKGPEIDANFDGPGINVNAPDVNFKGTKADLDLDISGQSGKFKKPNLNLPDLGLSGPKLHGPNLDLTPPDFDISGSNLSGAINAPDMNMPKVDFKTPKLDLNTPDVNLDMPSGKLKMPELHAPDWDLNAPSSKLKMPKFSLSGTLPKRPDVDLNADLKSTDFSLKAPKMKGGMNAPDLDFPNMHLKDPKLDVSTPDLNIGSPKTKLKFPKLKMPKFGLPNLKGPEIDANFDGPGINVNAPDVNFKGTKADLDLDISGQSGKFKKPNLNLPDLGLSGPKLHGPNLDLTPPDFDISGSNLSGAINAPDMNMPKVDFKTRKLDLNTPDVNLDMPSGKLKMPELHAPDWDLNAPSSKLKMPKFSLSGTLPKRPDVDLNADLKSTDFSLKAPKMKGGMNAPDLDFPNMHLKDPKLDVSTPDLNIGSPKTKLKFPKLKMPKFGLPNLKGPEIDANFDGPGINVNAPDVNFKGTKADLDLDISGQSGKFKKPNLNLPDLGLSGPKLHGPNLDLTPPDFDISGSNLSGAINAPDMNMPKVDFKTRKLDLNTPDVNLDMPSGKLKMPELHAPDWDLNAPSSKLKMPKFSLSGTLPKRPDVDLNADLKSTDFSLKAPKMKGGMNAPDLDFPNMHLKDPKLDVSTPDLNIGSPKTKLKFPKLKMPKFGLPNLKGPEIDANFDGPGINVNAPDVNFKGTKADLDLDISGQSGKFKKPNLNLPDLGLSGPKLHGPNLDLTPPDFDISGSNLSGAINAPDMNMPKVDFKTPKLDLNTPDVNLDMPSGKLKMPELHAPDWDLNAPSSKLKMNKFSLSGTLPKRPDVDLNADLKSTDFSLKAPKMKGGMNAPDLDFPNMHLKDPKLDVSTPDLNIGSPKTKLKFPKLKMPKFGLPNLKGPEIDANFDGPGINVNAPDVNFKGTKADLDLDISGQSGKFKKPNLNLPDLGLSGPKLHGPNLDLTPPDFDISGSNLSGAINAPDMNMPKVDFKTRKLDLNTPDVNLDMPSGKLKMPELHAPDWDLNAPSSKLKMPKFSLSGTLPKRPDVDLNADLKSTDFSLKAPKMKGGMNAPDLDFPNMHLKDPKLDMSTPDVNTGFPKAKFKMPKFKMPKISLPSLKGPDIDANFDGPKTDLNISGQSGKFKNPNFNLPDLGFSGPKIDGPNLDLTPPELDISSPNLGAGINVPDINMPKTDLKSPKMGLETPNLNSDMPSAELKMPTLARPKTELHGPDWDVSAPSSKLKWPKLTFSSTLPNMDLKAPKLDVNTPDVSIGSPKVKLKMPKMNLPNKKGPELNGNFDGPDADISVPNSNLKSSKTGFEVPNIDFGSSSGKSKMPNLKMPNVGFSGPKLHGPDLNFNSPDPDVKFPKESDLKLKSNLKAPDMNPSLPKMKGGFDCPSVGLPNMDFKDSKTGFEVPDVDFGSPRRTFKVPHLKMPDVGFSGAELDSPDLGLDLPNPNIKLPKGSNLKLNSDLKAPDLNLRASPRLKGPGVSISALELPDARIKGPKLDNRAKHLDVGINGDIGQPDMNFPGPQVKRNVGGPDVDMNIPSVDIHGPQTDLNLPDRKYKFPSFKLPQFGSPDINSSGCDIDFGASLRPTNLDISPPNANLNVKSGELKGHLTSVPNMDVKMPKAATCNPQLHLKSPDLDIDNPSLKLKKPSYKNRRSDMTSMRMKAPDLDIDQDARLHHTNRKSPRTKVRSSYPAGTDPLHQHVDFSRSDLNIDDFTGKDYVLTARGSWVDIDTRDPKNNSGMPTGNKVRSAHVPSLSRDSKTKVPGNSDGYYVTVFPTQTQNPQIPNRKFNTVGGFNFRPGNMDLEVPGENDVKGSTFFFSNLV